VNKSLAAAAPAMAIPIGWQPIGPFAIPHGQTYGSGPGSRPGVSGRISAIAVDPSNPNNILIGAAGGGVWQAQDGGLSWHPRTDNQPSLAMGAIAFDPTTPSTVYGGTGEGNFFRRLGTGLLRSTDGGTTWTMLATAPFVGTGFFDIIVDPLNGTHLLAGTSGGLFESANAGMAWTARRSAMTFDLSMHPGVLGDPNSTQEVFAGCLDGLLRSTNGGTAWSSMTLPGAPASFQRIAVCHAPSDGNIVYVFASDGTNGYLWRRTAFGGAFTAVSPLPADLSTGQSWYDWFAATAPNNPDVLYLGAINVHKGIRSPADVWTWTNISGKPAGDSIHPDQHAIAFSPTDPNVVFVGNDGGIYRSPDAGTAWKSLNRGLCITELEYVAQHPQFEAWMLGGTQDNGTERFEGEEVWFHVQDGDGGDCGVNSSLPYTCYHTFYGMGMERSTTGGGWGSWSWIGPNPPAGYSALFYPPLDVNGDVVAQAGSSVFISTNTGTSFTSVNLPAGAGVASALVIQSVTRIYAGTNQGQIFRIDFSGGAWQAPVALTTPRVGFVSDLEVDPANPSRLWATYSTLAGTGHVFRSDNGGTTWTDVSAGLPAIPFNALVVDPANTNAVYAAADVGVFRSTNAGGAWSSFANGLPNVLVKDLVFHAGSRLLRAATQSRGVWEIPVDQATMPDVEVYLRDSAVDTGRLSPSPSGINDPFNFGSVTWLWQCQDIKVDSPPFQRPLPTDVDFEAFDDDHGVFLAGLLHENTTRGRTVRVFVQVHNRGVNAATNTAVKAFFVDASVGLPDLPAGFWTNFPNNTLPVASPWQAIAPHAIVPTVEPGHAEVVSFDWAVPVSAADHSCLLAIISAADDSITTTELAVGALVANNKKCGLKNLTVVNPPPMMGPAVYQVALNLWPTRGVKRYALTADKGSEALVRGVLFSKRLSTLAKAARLERMTLTADDKARLKRLVTENPRLRERLDLNMAYRTRRHNVLLEKFELAKEPEPMVVLVDPNAKPGHWSFTQRDAEGGLVGGFTLQSLDQGRGVEIAATTGGQPRRTPRRRDGADRSRGVRQMRRKSRRKR
jgi:photosystem II stability/assembly factor-like uncharacterized protein